MDSLNFVGPTRDMGVAGAERSSLYDSSARVSKRMGLQLAAVAPGPAGVYFRADHFIFAKAGVPAFRIGTSVFSGDGTFKFTHDQAASQSKMLEFKEHYHQVTDQYDPAWDLSGMVPQSQFTLNLGYEVANDAALAQG